MSKVVSFSITDGGVVGKSRKRLRGDNNRKPEIKKCDFAGGSNYSFQTCVCNYIHNVPSEQRLATYLYNHEPSRISYPSQGSTSSTYIGSTIFLKYFRIKGYLVNLVNNPVQVRWRLCLVRIDWSGIDNPTFGTDQYLNLFKTVSILPTTSMNDLGSTVTGAATNFYAKQKDVEEWASIKRVVIAAGVLPPATTFRKDAGYTNQTSGGATAGYYNQIYSGIDANSEAAGYRGYTPIDVKVTLNDRVSVLKNLVRYYLVFESDCGLGFRKIGDDGATDDRDPYLVPSVDWPSKSPIKIRFQGTTYYTDA